MVTGIKLISQQQVNTMGLSGISTPQIASLETPMKRATASDTRRVSFEKSVNDKKRKKLAELKIFLLRKINYLRSINRNRVWRRLQLFSHFPKLKINASE